VSPAEILVEVAGWAGMLMILSAYALLTAERVNSRSPLYQWLNVVGGAGFIVNGWWHGAIPSASLNVIWMLIGVVALWRMKAKGSSTSAT
jgi:hypothetical protein